jgi:DNA-binding PadR family transcriptional regulator
MFSPQLAVKIGVNGALLLEYIIFWNEKNAISKRNFFDGFYWTYNTIKELHTIFPYLSQRIISNTLDKLESDGYIKTGNYNKIGFYRTKWYAVTKLGLGIFIETNEKQLKNLEILFTENDISISQKRKMDFTNNENGFVENVNTIPAINSADNSSNKQKIYIVQFEKFWNLYDKKVAKDKCFKKFMKLSQSDIELIFKNLPEYIESTPDIQYRKNPETYLNNKSWNDEIIVKSIPNKPAEPEKPNSHTYNRNFTNMSREEYLSDIR